MSQIVACGGISDKYDAYDKAAANYNYIEDYLFGGGSKNVLYIPTAGADGEDNVHDALAHYRGNFNCSAEVLYLVNSAMRGDYAAKIAAADVIFVGGGNTLFMVKLWRKLGVDSLLRAAFERGTVIAGVSAGANCWHAFANSNAKKSKNPDAPLMRVTCLGWIPLLFCPHYLGEDYRRPGLKEMLRVHGGTALGVDDDTAVEYRDSQWRLLFNGSEGRAWRCFWRKGEYCEQRLPWDGKYRPLEELVERDVMITDIVR